MATKAKLQEQLTKKGIDFPEDANVDALKALLKEDAGEDKGGDGDNTPKKKETKTDKSERKKIEGFGKMKKVTLEFRKGDDRIVPITINGITWKLIRGEENEIPEEVYNVFKRNLNASEGVVRNGDGEDLKKKAEESDALN